MTVVSLSMKYGERALRAVEAWYLPGDDPARWVAEVASWDINQTSVRFLPLPSSAAHRKTQGALVGTAGGDTPQDSKNGIPYGLIAERLYLPVEASLFPEATHAELDSLLSEEYTYVWHPIAGLVAFEHGDALRMSDLLSFGPALDGRWDCAQSGVIGNRRLITLSPEESLSYENILQSGQDDIGSQTDELSELPRSPAEPKPGLLSAISQQGMKAVAGMAKWLTRSMPQSAGGAARGGSGAASHKSATPGWISQLGQWAERQLSEISQKLEAARHKEISRLLHLLETDPDKGLRFALPLDGDAHRGRGAPTGRLGEHIPDFNLNNLGGGGAGDFWEISHKYQQQLIVRYRELANREMRLGRYRRAAYIFAELLADYSSAAAALVEGKHMREAAALYRTRLNRPWDAAECLAQGGHWMEALSIYEGLGAYENAGDIYQRLGQTASAQEQFRKAVQRHLAQGDRLAAARLLEVKLDSADEAIEELEAGWPDSAQATSCLRELFQIFARHGRHATAKGWIKKFQSQPVAHKVRPELVEILTNTAGLYPDEGVKTAAADCTRIVVSQTLQEASDIDHQSLLSFISRLVPQDRLLSRDCRRYLKQRPPLELPVQPSYPLKPNPRLIRTIELNQEGISWESVVQSRDAVFVAGKSENLLVLARCSWMGFDPPLQGCHLTPAYREFPILLNAGPGGRTVVIHLVGAPELMSNMRFKPSDHCPFTTKAGSMTGMSRNVLGSTRTFHGITWLVEVQNHGLTLVARGPLGEFISSQVIPQQEIPDDLYYVPNVVPLPIVACNDRIYLALCNQLLIFEKDKPVETIEHPHVITNLAMSALNTRRRIVVSFATGGTLYWDDFEGRHSSAFASNLEAPLACINRGGYLIAVSGRICVIYTTHDRRLRFVAEIITTAHEPIAVIPGPATNSFAIVSKKGAIDLYEI